MEVVNVRIANEALLLVYIVVDGIIGIIAVGIYGDNAVGVRVAR